MSVESRRKLLAARSSARTVDLAQVLYGPQAKFATSQARFRVARTSRRAGKTVACPAMLCDAALKHPGSVALYITRTRQRAKDLIWRPLVKWNEDRGLGGRSNETELAIHFPNGSRVCLAGANTRDEIEKRRGDAFSLVIVDEAQSLPMFLRDLVDDILAPGLMDFAGSLAMTGTPPPVPVGYFAEACRQKGWELHEWTVWENPFIEAKAGMTVRQMLDAELARKGAQESDPSIQREWFGKSVVDLNSLVFQFDATRNSMPAELPPLEGKVLGVDLGFNDADALAVLGWPKAPELYLVEELVTPKQTLSQLVEQIKAMVERHKPLAVVVDQGGLGKKIVESLQQEHRLYLEAAEKDRKFEFIEMLNDMLRTGRFHAPQNSRFAQDAMLLEWDMDKTSPDRKVVKDTFHSDICDAVLYAYRRALHWLTHEAPRAPLPKVGTPEWHDAEKRRTTAWLEAQEARAEAEIRERKQERESYGKYLDNDVWSY